MKLSQISCLTVLLILLVSGGIAKTAPVCWSENGHCYDRVAAPGLNWEDAKAEAESLTFQSVNGHLATITSQQENDFIVDNLGGYSAVEGYFLGGFSATRKPRT